MTLLTLQDILGAQIDEVQSLDAEYPTEERAMILSKAETTAKLAKQMINNADVVLRADKLAGSTSRIDSVVGE